MRFGSATPVRSGDYSRRIGRVVEHTRSNLEADLSLQTLAKVAYFSPYHVHRIFRTTSGTLRFSAILVS